MAFTGYAFLLFFFVVVLPLRWLLPPRWAPHFLLAASVLFYVTWGWKLAILLGALTFITYRAGIAIRAATDPKRKKALLAGSVTLLLGTLATFKYSGLFLSFFGVKAPELPLPLGISFYVFEMISYVVDVYRGDDGAESLPEFALYVSYFPHLIAGPIVRASELMPQLRKKVRFDAERAQQGMFVFLTGVAKKMVIADNLALFSDAVFAQPGLYNNVEVLAGIAAYTGQIFCDFSGYTDIARGASTMLGYELPENFDYPYLSKSITEFWRRWHMTLSRWLRDYLYISLGGNRGGRLATYRNLFLTMTLGGLWHGARLTFVFWGMYHGALLALHKLFLVRTGKSATWNRWREHVVYRGASLVGTLALVMVGWVFFRATTFDNALLVFSRLTVMPLATWKPTRLLDLTSWFLLALVVLHAAGALKLGIGTHQALQPVARGVFWALIVVVVYAFAVASPTFIYFYF